MHRSTHARRTTTKAARLASLPLLALLLAGWLVLLPACDQSPRAGRSDSPNVIVVLVDAMRADHLGCYGYARATSPVIDALAAEGTLFETTVSQASWTKPSIPSLFTGLYPIQHGVVTGNKRDAPGRITSDVLDDEDVTLAEVFKAGGYATAAFVHNAQISSFMGFDQGFDTYVEQLGDAMSITEHFLGWLREHPERPFFAYVHYLDTHWPYTPPAPFDALFPAPAGATVDFNNANWKQLERQVRAGELELGEADVEAMRALYDGEIRYTDALLGQLFATLRAGRLDRNTIVVVTADHGEEFLEHGGVGHGHSLYDEVLRIPLIIRVPGEAPRRIAEQVELIDVLPTLAELTGLEPPAELPGRSLAGLLRGRRGGAARIAFADHRPGGDHGHWLQSARDGRYKLIRSFALPAPAGGGPDPGSVIPPLAAGMWLEVDGEYQEGGTFHALQVERMEERNELSLAGPARGLDLASGSLRLLGIRCRLLEKAHVQTAARHEIGRGALGEGVWIKARGRVDGNRFLLRRARLIEDPSRREPEIKAPVTQVVRHGDGSTMTLGLAGIIDVTIDGETRFQGSWPAAATATPGSPPPRPPRASQSQLREQRVRLEVELYDLHADPGEQTNLASRLPDRVRALDAALDRWEARLARDQQGGGEIALDAEVLKQLRALGYVQ